MKQLANRDLPDGVLFRGANRETNRGTKITQRVLIYAHFFAPSIGGVETYARLLAQGLSERTEPAALGRIEVTVATHTPARPDYDARFSFRVVREPRWLGLLKLVRGATVVHLTGPSLLPMLFALVLQKPFVIEQHGYQAACPNGMLLYEPTKEVCPGHFMAGRYLKCLQCNRGLLGWRKSLQAILLTFPRRWLCRHTDANLPITRHVARRIDLPRSWVVYYGVPDPLLLNQDSPSAVCHGSWEPLCFAYVGRLVTEKGVSVLLQASKGLRDQGCRFRVKIIGDGPERARLEALVGALGLQGEVTFTGFLDGDALKDALLDVMALVMPSICEETAGLAAIEQMFRGRLVIASDIGGLGEVIGQAGLKFPPGDVGALTNCMKEVLEKPDMASQFGQQARARALSCFGLERMLDEHLAVYDEIGA